MISVNAHDVQWGDVPTWLGALSSLGALVAAVVAALIARRVYEIESRRDQRAEDDQRERQMEAIRSQASRVSIWWDIQYRELGQTGQRIGSRAAMVRNASELPIHFVQVFFGKRVAAGEYEELEPVFRQVIPPNPQPVPVQPPEGIPVRPNDPAGEDVPVSVIFTDAAGYQWRRDPNGQLHLLRRFLDLTEEE